MEHAHASIKPDKDQVDWIYLTTDSMEALRTVLDDYDQTVNVRTDSSNNQSDIVAHVLRVYLIDPEKKIRNI